MTRNTVVQRYARVGTAVLARALVGAMPAHSREADGLSLQLDINLSVGMAPASPDDTTSRIIEFGASDIRNRLLKVRDRIESMEIQAQASQRSLADREQLIGELQHVIEAQDGAISALKTELSRPRPQDFVTAAVSREPAPAVPISQNQSKSPSDVTTTGLPPRLGLPVDRLIVDVGLVGAIVLLLGWSLYLRSRVGAESTRGLEELEAAQEAPTKRRFWPSSARRDEADSEDPAARAAEKADIAARLASIDEELRRLPSDAPDNVLPLRPADDDDEPTVTRASLAPPVEAPTPAPPVPASDPTLERQPIRPPEPEPEPINEPAPAEVGGVNGENEAQINPQIDAQIDPAERWSQTMIRRTAADPNALREVDTLLAFENYEPAARLLEELMAQNPDNPEYRVRLVHVQAELGHVEESEKEEEILAAMMDGPLSETLYRVKEIGRGLLPGHPLFDEEERSRMLQRASQSLDLTPAPAVDAGSDTLDKGGNEVLDELFASDDLPEPPPDPNSPAGDRVTTPASGNDIDLNLDDFELEPLVEDGSNQPQDGKGPAT